MRRIAVLFVVIVFVTTDLLGGWVLGISAQVATPGPEAALPEGVTLEMIAAGEAAAVPAAPAMFNLFRVRLAPGAVFALPADDPGLALIYVESGELTMSSTVPIVVNRASTIGTPGVAEPVEANTMVVLGQRDFFIAPPISGGEYRNDGTEELVGLVASLEPVEANGAG